MGWAKTGVAGMVLSAALAVGCQSKLYDQNKQLMEENRELRAQNERQGNTGPAQAQIAPGPQAAAPQQPAVIPGPETQPIEQPQAAHRPVEQIGGLETTVSRSGNTIVHLPSDVFFDSGQATLKASAKTSLDKVVAALNNKFSARKLRVEGHTDSQPIRVSRWASNQELSEARAATVKDYLVAKGVSTGRITIKGYGDTKPRGSEMSKNRRVEIVVLTAPSAGT